MSDIDELLKEAPTLTFEPVLETSQEETQVAEVKPEKIEKTGEELGVELSPEEQKMVNDFAAQIDITNTQQVLQFGAGCQKKIADFSDTGGCRTEVHRRRGRVKGIFRHDQEEDQPALQHEGEI